MAKWNVILLANANKWDNWYNEGGIKCTMIKYEVSTGCTICGMCIVVCPVKAIALGPKGAVINQEKCTGCGTCCRNCASEAIHKVK